MSPSQIFHIPSALRKSKRPIADVQWPVPGSDGDKISRILGTATDLDRSLSVATTAYETRRIGLDAADGKIPSIAVTAATTEPTESVDLRTRITQHIRDLDRRPSSVLLRDGYQVGSQRSASPASRGMRNYSSSSTLNSHYEAKSVPSAISQQTSESSARDRALRKGLPIAVQQTAAEQPSLREPRTFKFSTENTKSKKSSTQTGDFSSPAPSFSSGHRPDSRTQHTPNRHTKTSRYSKTVTFTPSSSGNDGSSSRSNALDRKTFTSAQHRPQPVPATFSGNPPYFKINVRKPKPGVKNWFDDADEYSSEEEHHEEPELKQAFVDGLEDAFGDRFTPLEIARKSITASPQPATFLESPATHYFPSLSSSLTGSIPVSPVDPGSHLTLKIPSTVTHSDEPMCFPTDRKPLRPKKSCHFEDVNLGAQSVLYLSSSEDEDEVDIERPLPIRDSLTVDSIMSTEAEIGTARAVSRRTTGAQRASQIQRYKTALSHKHSNSGSSLASIQVPLRRSSSRMQSYLSDQSSFCEESRPAQTPPSEPVNLPAQPAGTDGALPKVPLNSTLLMTVTRQEELLLAQMRLKRVEMLQDDMRSLSRQAPTQNSSSSSSSGHKDRSSSSSGHKERSSSSGNKDRNSFILHQPRPKLSNHAMTVAEYLDRGLHVHRYSTASNSTRFRDSYASLDDRKNSRVDSRASGTTFQTQTNRASTTTFQTTSTRYRRDDRDGDADDDGVRYSPSLTISESVHSPETPTSPPPNSHHLSRRRASSLRNRPTSLESGFEYRTHKRTRSRTQTDGRVIVLDNLDKEARRSEVRSQDFIEWPYHGWDNMGMTVPGVTVAH